MARFDNPVGNVRVASPCNADWDQMLGNARTRFCAQCNLNVYNLSSMTRTEAERLIGGSEGRLCVRYFKRSDGSILTSDCPVGLRALRRKMSYVARAVSAAVLTFLAGIGVYVVRSRYVEPRVGWMGQMVPEVQVAVPVVQPAEASELILGRLELEPPPKPKPRVRKRARLRS